MNLFNDIRSLVVDTLTEMQTETYLHAPHLA